MKGTDKFLLAIVAGVVLLVMLAFVVTLLRPPRTYLAEDKPEGVAYNYLFAIQQQDYPRAYTYLSSKLKGYPASAEAFAEDISRNRLTFSTEDASRTWAVDSTRTIGDLAFVTIRETRFYGGGIFGNSQYSTDFEMRLRREDSAWKIVGSDSQWLYCWESTGGCH